MKTTKQTRDELRAAIVGNGAVAMSLSLLGDLLDDVEEADKKVREIEALTKIMDGYRQRTSEAEEQLRTLKVQYETCFKEREIVEKKVQDQDLVGRDEVMTARKRLSEITEAAAELQAIAVTDSHVRPSSRVGRAIEKFMAVAQPGEKAGDALAAIVEYNALKDALGKLVYAAQRVVDQSLPLDPEMQSDLLRAIDYARDNLGPERRVAGVSTEPFMAIEQLREQLERERAAYQALCDDKADWIHKATAAERERQQIQHKLLNIASFVNAEVKR